MYSLSSAKATTGYVIAAALLLAGCQKGSAPRQSLPVRSFFQAPVLPQGTVTVVDQFPSADESPAGQLLSISEQQGRAYLAVEDVSGSVVKLTTQPGFFLGAVAGGNPSLRVACATEVFGRPKGQGPRGLVHEYDRAAGTKLVCWSTPRDKENWTPVVLASSTEDRTKVAYWLMGMDGSDDSVQVAYLRDSEFSPGLLLSAGRPATDRSFVRAIKMDKAGAPSLGDLAEDDFPDMSGMGEGLTRVTCDDHCGYLFNGSSWLACGKCAAGECVQGVCREESCTAVSKAQACAEREDGAPACGQRSDACSGLLDCGSCPADLSCGADADLQHCSRRPLPSSPAQLRAAYQDDLKQLCGTFHDDAWGTVVTLGNQCPHAGQSCVSNLCIPLVSSPASAADPDDAPFVLPPLPEAPAALD